MAPPNSEKSAPTVTHLGSYRLLEPLGSGGMSSVFRAVHEGSGYEVAVKVLPRYLARKQTLLQRFLREAQVAEALEHPNIVSIYDRGSEDGRHYLVLEFVDGPDLHDRVRRLGPLGVPDAIRTVEQAAEGLRYAASLGLIHRDIKPANLLMEANGTVKVIDLGLALRNEAEDERVTRDGTTVGTVDYMSPEQARDSRSATLRSDIYSLGCTFHYLLTGFPPFAGGHIADKLRRHALQAPPDVRQLRPDVPRPVARLIQRMMAKRPEDRFGSYEELIEALRSLDLEPGSDGETESGDSFEFAMIVEEEDDPDFELGEGVGLAGVASTQDAPPVRPDVPLPPEPPRTPKPVEPEHVNLSELAELLDDQDEPASRPALRRPPEQPPRPIPRAHPGRHRRSPNPFDPFADLGGGPESPAMAALPIARRRSGIEEASARDWAIGGALVGLAIALLGFALISLLRMDWPGLGESDGESDRPGNVSFEPRPRTGLLESPSGGERSRGPSPASRSRV